VLRVKPADPIKTGQIIFFFCVCHRQS